jgi:hypothetical protein
MAHAQEIGPRRLATPEMALTVALLALVLFRVAAPVWALAVNSPRLPQWDMAKYGVSGLRLARALQDVEALAFFRQLNDLDVWPPVFPLLEIPAFLVAGPGYASARGLVALLFAAAILAAYWCGLQTDSRRGIAVGALATALVATSPMAQVFATVVMLEIPGTVLLLLAVGFYLRSVKPGRGRDFTVACIAATALFLCKYNYGLIWLLPMVTNEILRHHDPKALVASATPKRLGALLRRPWPAFLACGLLVAAIIEIAGPWRFTVGGREVSVSSAGQALYTLYAVVLLSWLLRPRRSLARGRRWFGCLGPRDRAMVLAIALPIGIWMVVPSHTINFVDFLSNRSAGPPPLSLESLLFYPRVFLSQYSPTPVAGAILLILGALSLRRLRSTDPTGRVIALALLVSTVAAVAHPYKQPRFFFISATLLWVAGSREVVELAERAAFRTGEMAERWIIATVAVSSLVAASLVAVDAGRLERHHRRLTVDEATAEVVSEITDHAADYRSSVLLGTWNHLSPWLVEWSCLQRGPSMETSQAPRSPTGRRYRKDLFGWLLAERPDLVMVLSAAPGSSPRAGFVTETGWLGPVRRRLTRDPLFRLVSRKDFPDAGYRLEGFEAARANREPVPR